MGKAPAFQFYFKDWLSDPQLTMASHSTKGIWADMLCYMWAAPERGELKGTKAQITRLVAANEYDMERFWSDAEELGFCDLIVTKRNGVTDDNKIITVRNRRMWREEKDKDNNRERQARYRDKRKSNDEVTPLSPSPSPSPTPNKELKAPDGPFELPSKEVIMEASELKIKEDIESVTKQLYDEKIFVKVHAFKNLALKQNQNLRSILHTLSRCYIAKPPEPWGYCLKTIGLENLNYNERDHVKNSR